MNLFGTVPGAYVWGGGGLIPYVHFSLVQLVDTTQTPQES